MTDDQEEMLYQHLLIKVKNRIPQQQCVPLVGQGQKVRTLRNKSLALIQDASHRLIDIALQKPLDIIDQLLLSTLNGMSSRQYFEDAPFLINMQITHPIATIL
jgi:hypothetical protein